MELITSTHLMPRFKTSGAIPPLLYAFMACGALLSTGTALSCIKVKVKFNLEQATKAQRGSSGIALLVL